MSERQKHTFQFSAAEIADAARKEAEYHEAREAHWQARFDKAVEVVERTISAKLVDNEVTGGKRIGVVVNYGDPEAWSEATLAESKIQLHREAARRYRTDHRVYATQFDRAYELDTEDVHHLRLGDEERED